jgi:ribosomal protein L16/L10AE
MSKILKKVFKKTIKTKKSNNYKKILFGKFGLQSLANGILTKRQLEAARRSISKRTKRICKL